MVGFTWNSDRLAGEAPCVSAADGWVPVECVVTAFSVAVIKPRRLRGRSGGVVGQNTVNVGMHCWANHAAARSRNPRVGGAAFVSEDLGVGEPGVVIDGGVDVVVPQSPAGT